jgi:hypothetical protein
MSILDELVIIGFDSEWVYDPVTKSNVILSYQYAGRTAKGTWTGIIYPDSAKRARIRMVDLLGKAIEQGRKEKHIGFKWPKTIHAAAHFSRADLAAFQDFSHLKDKFEGIRKTFATLTAPWKTRYNDASNNRHDLTVYLIDTMLLTPGSAGLAELGEMYGFEKITLPSGMISRMDQLLRDDPDLFKAYAIRDAEIAALHAWKMAEFANTNFGMTKLPISLSSLAVRHLKELWRQERIDPGATLGIEEEKKFKRWDKKAARFRGASKTVHLPIVYENAPLATECFHGGRNEAYYFGFTDVDVWTDFDLAGAYTTAMAAIRQPDYDAMKMCLDPWKYTADLLGIARISFKFPLGTRFPCLPVRTANGLVFPLEGTTSVAAPEIHLAVEMGADVTIEHGIIVPSKSDTRPFELFSKSIRDKRASCAKGSVEERTWKEIGNSLYGKIAQGLQGKRVYDSLSSEMRKLPPSEVTQPYFAAYITSLVRAVLGEILHRIPANRMVVSATTDGFLTNATEAEIDLSGGVCQFFSFLRERVSGDPKILEVKHRSMQLLCWKTRGQASVEFTGQNMPPVIAKAGISPPEDVVERAYQTAYRNWDCWDYESPGIPDPAELRAQAHADWIVGLFLQRNADTTLRSSSLRSLRDMVEGDADLVPEESEQRVNMEYDWKRELIDQNEKRAFASPARVHLAANSRPWRTVEDFERERTLFDQWRMNRNGVLKTMSDWNSWIEYRKTAELSKKGLRRSPGGLIVQFRRNFLRGYVRGLWGLPGDDYKGLAGFLTAQGYETSEHDLKNAKRSKQEPIEQAFDLSEEVRAFIETVRSRFPRFEWQRLVTDQTFPRPNAAD